MASELEKIKDGICNLDTTLEKIFENGRDEKNELEMMKNHMRNMLDVMGLEIAPTLRDVKQDFQDFYELQVAQSANDTIMKMLEAKKMYRANEISELDFVLAIDGLSVNFSHSIRGKNMGVYSARVQSCIPNLTEDKQKKKLDELDKHKIKKVDDRDKNK